MNRIEERIRTERLAEAEAEKDARKGTNQTAIGRCRRHAPTMSGYPVVFDNDWCGDHKLNETIL